MAKVSKKDKTLKRLFKELKSSMDYISFDELFKNVIEEAYNEGYKDGLDNRTERMWSVGENGEIMK